MLRTLDVQATEFYDYDISLSTLRLDAQQLREFVDSQMPSTGIGEVPWSTPLSSDQLTELAEADRAEFVTARMMLAADSEPPLIGIGAFVRAPDIYPSPRMIIVIDSESRGFGIGSRIAKELLKRLKTGETVQAEVQQKSSKQAKAARFFERLGFKCVNENYRIGNIPEFVDGKFSGNVQRVFSLYSYTEGAEV